MGAKSLAEPRRNARRELHAELAAWQAQHPGTELMLHVAGEWIAGRAQPTAISHRLRRAAQVSLLLDLPIQLDRRAGGAPRCVPLRQPWPAVLVISGAPLEPQQLDALRESVIARWLPAAVRSDPWQPLLASSPSLAAVIEPLRRVSRTPLPVLLLGPTGVGKELIARAVHAASGRTGLLIAENCSALPESLLEAELFGVRRGAFTGADRHRRGRLLAADGGTLLLDEVGDLPASIQVKLLRVLQEREVRPLGGEDPVRMDLRIVAATHHDLPQLVAQGTFRSDLYFRLAGATVHVPALQARRDDLPQLLATLIERAVAEGLGPGRRLAWRSFLALRERDWPGNVRELDHSVRRAMVNAQGERILPEDLPHSDPVAPSAEQERQRVDAALRAARGVKADAARRLGWSRQKLYRRLAGEPVNR